MREIGSEFWDVPAINDENGIFPESTKWFLSGRSALQVIIKELGGVSSVLLPSWCCDSIIKPFADVGFEVRFYPVYFDGGLVQEIRLDSDVLFLMDYFGYTTANIDLSDYKGMVIRDVTHSIFSTSYSDAHYYFGSLRKWCGVWTGGYAWTKDGHRLPMEKNDDYGYTGLREKTMQQKAEYIEGMREDKNYLRAYDEAEKALEGVGIAPAADRDVELAKKLDVEFIKTQRRKNAEVLRAAFLDWLIFPNHSSKDTPMFVPILVPDGKRDELRRYLIQNEIYCPIHWPVSKYHKLNERERFLYDNELTLVCDQRYTKKDMNRVVKTIKMFMGE